MGRYVRRKILALPFVLLGVSFLVFGAIRLLPGDPARIMAGPQASGDAVAGMRARLGLDQPFLVQYGLFLAHAAHGDLGTSIRSRQPVAAEVGSRIPYTVALATSAYGFAILVGTLAGVAAAARPGSLVDTAVMLATVLAASTANFWLALVGMMVFAVQLGWLPLLGAGGPAHYVLPTLALGLLPTAMIARMTRSSLQEVLGQDFVRTARAKGLGEIRVYLRHGLRNAMIPIVTVVGLNFGGLLGGAVVTETVFNWPGLGALLVESVRDRDYPVIEALVLLAVLCVIVINLLADVAIAVLDPRVRFE